MSLLKGYQQKDKVLFQAQEKVHNQARVHMSRDGLSDFLSELRPNEDPGIQKWRKDNLRRYTRGGVNSYYALFSRLFTNSGIKLNEASPKLFDFLATKPFRVSDKSMTLMNWFFNSAMWDGGVDPNGKFVFWPLKPKGTYEDTGVPVQPQTKFFAYHEDQGIIQFEGADFRYFAVQLSKELIKNFDSGLHEHWLVGENKIAVYRDVMVANKQETILLWEHQHNIGDYPIGGTVSFTSKLKGGQELCESFICDYLELADESQSRFNNGQAVSIMHDFPIRMMLGEFLGMKCTNKKCSRLSGRTDTEPCGTCGGSGFDLKKLGAFSTYFIDNNSIIDKPLGMAPITYAQPDSANINNSHDKGLELYALAKRELGLDLVDGITESGVAREMRFEQIQDNLGKLAQSCKMFLEKQLYFYEAYLSPKESERVIPVIYVPRNLKIKNAEILLEEAIKAIPIDKQSAQMSYIEEKYMDDPNKVRSCKLSFIACPSLLLSESEMMTRTTQSIYSKWEWYKRDTIQPIVYEIVKENPDANDQSIIQKALLEVKANFAVVELENNIPEEEIIAENADDQ